MFFWKKNWLYACSTLLCWLTECTLLDWLHLCAQAMRLRNPNTHLSKGQGREKRSKKLGLNMQRHRCPLHTPATCHTAKMCKKYAFPMPSTSHNAPRTPTWRRRRLCFFTPPLFSRNWLLFPPLSCPSSRRCVSHPRQTSSGASSSNGGAAYLPQGGVS